MRRSSLPPLEHHCRPPPTLQSRPHRAKGRSQQRKGPPQRYPQHRRQPFTRLRVDPSSARPDLQQTAASPLVRSASPRLSRTRPSESHWPRKASRAHQESNRARHGPLLPINSVGQPRPPLPSWCATRSSEPGMAWRLFGPQQNRFCPWRRTRTPSTCAKGPPPSCARGILPWPSVSCPVFLKQATAVVGRIVA